MLSSIPKKDKNVLTNSIKKILSFEQIVFMAKVWKISENESMLN